MQGLLQQNQMHMPCSHGTKQKMCLPSPYKPVHIYCCLTDEFHSVMLTTGSGNYSHTMTGQSLRADDSSSHFVEHHVTLFNKIQQNSVPGPHIRLRMLKP